VATLTFPLADKIAYIQVFSLLGNKARTDGWIHLNQLSSVRRVGYVRA
jgi:hypothetical protein